jgi:hypothetical protein
VHLLRNSFRYASKRDWAQLAKDLKPVYTAASEAEALDRFAEFSGKWEKRYPAIIRLWENAWAEFVPFLRFDREIRTVICTTNAMVILSPFWISPGHEGFLRLRHVADVRFWAQLRTQKRSDKGIDAGHVSDISSGASWTPLKITRPLRNSKARKATSETPQSGLEITIALVVQITVLISRPERRNGMSGPALVRW